MIMGTFIQRMSAIIRRLCTRRRKRILMLCGILSFSYYLSFYYLFTEYTYDLEITRRSIEKKLSEALKEDKGTGCNIPQLDPFAAEVMQFEKLVQKITCPGVDWVKCHLHECKVVQEILNETKDIVCTYRDIVYNNDYKYTIGTPVDVFGTNSYILHRSDHVKVNCVGKQIKSMIRKEWTGHGIGFRTSAKPKQPPLGRETSLDVLIFVFDSASRNGFIRRMPNSYDYLKALGGIVLDGYNIVGDGTPAALFPILTGRTEFELPEARKKVSKNRYMDDRHFIFYRLKGDGYRTAYFEDTPSYGTFQYRFNGFERLPADHYLRAFFVEQEKSLRKHWWDNYETGFCVGATPRYKLMMDITDQFLDTNGKKFGFSFISDISHDDFNLISTADDDMVDFLKTLKEKGRLENTLVFVMGDHGPRFVSVRKSMQGKLEERLPLVCLLVPPSLSLSRPSLLATLRNNSRVLTTPHDIHSTLLDALGLPNTVDYKVPGADLPRGMSLFEPIPESRSCSEAGVEAHWCVCLKWVKVSDTDPICKRVADAMVKFINAQTRIVRSECVPRTLTSIEWVMRHVPNKSVLTFISSKAGDNDAGKFADEEFRHNENYQIKFVVGPGKGEFEASLKYLVQKDTFVIDVRDISRTNAYRDEPDCISESYPHLNMFCYCSYLETYK